MVFKSFERVLQFPSGEFSSVDILFGKHYKMFQSGEFSLLLCFAKVLQNYKTQQSLRESAAISGIIGCVNQTQASPLNFRFPFLTARWKNYNKENWGCGGSIPDICKPW